MWEDHHINIHQSESILSIQWFWETLVSHWKIPIGKSLGFPVGWFRWLVSGVAMTVTDSETWSIGSVEPVNVADPSQSRLLRSSFFYTGLASLLAWQVVLSLGRCELMVKYWIDVVLVWCSLFLTAWCVSRCFTMCFMRLLCRTFRWPLLFSSKDLHPQLRLLHLFRATFRWSGLGILVFHRVLVGGEHQSAHPYLTDRGGHHSLFVSLECHLVTLDSLDTSINTSIHLQYMFKMSHPLFNIC